MAPDPFERAEARLQSEERTIKKLVHRLVSRSEMIVPESLLRQRSGEVGLFRFSTSSVCRCITCMLKSCGDAFEGISSICRCELAP